MRKGIFRRNNSVVLGLLIAVGTVFARADVIVDVTLFSLSPNPVNISTGEVVYWTDADGGGPYGIYSSTGQWSTMTDSSGIIFTDAGTYGYYDDNGNIGTINVTLNIPPFVMINSPTNQTKFPAPASFQFSVTASDTDPDGLSDVEFYIGTNLVDDIFSDPFTTSVTNLPTGQYTLTAIAYDNVGATTTNSVSITVGPVLIAARLGNQLLVSWNTNGSNGLSLQSTTNLISGTGWAGVPTAPALVGSQWVVTNPIVGGKQFFRLSSH